MDQKEVMEMSLGEILKNAREKQKKTIEEISNQLKIKNRDILALENNDSEFIEKHFYIISLIKSYGKLLKIDAALIEKKISELNINSSRKNYRLINIGKKNIHSPNQKTFLNAILIFTLLYLVMFLIHRLQAEHTITSEVIINELNKIN